MGPNEEPVARTVARSLGKIGVDGVKAVLPKLLAHLKPEEDRHPRNQAQAAEFLGLLGKGAGDAKPQLRVALKDASWLVRLHAAGALLSIDPEERDAATAVITILEDCALGRLPQPEVVREEVCTDLQRIGKPVVPVLATALEHKNRHVRSAAAFALWMREDAKPAVPELLKALDDTDYYVRRNAAIALGLSGDDRSDPAIKTLQEVVRREDRATAFPTRQAAVDALGKILDRTAPIHLGVDVVLQPGGDGVLIRKVHPNSLASRIGLRESEVILEIDGEFLNGVGNLAMIVATHKEGDEVELLLVRGGKREKVKVTLTSRPRPSGR
jgi:HEAT repeat protein